MTSTTARHYTKDAQNKTAPINISNGPTRRRNRLARRVFGVSEPTLMTPNPTSVAKAPPNGINAMSS